MSMAFFAGGMPGPLELLLILVLILLLFGAKKLPDLARSLGKSLGEFKKGREEGADDGGKPSDSKQQKPPAGQENAQDPKDPAI